MIQDAGKEMVYQVRSGGLTADDIATELTHAVWRCLVASGAAPNPDPHRWPHLQAAIAARFAGGLVFDPDCGTRAACRAEGTPSSAPSFLLVLKGGLLQFIDRLAAAAAAELAGDASFSARHRAAQTHLKGALQRALSPYLFYHETCSSCRGLPAAGWQFRALRPEDEEKLRRFHESLSDRSVYLRYLHPYKLSARTSHARLARVCSADGGRDAVLAAVAPTKEGEEIISVGRLSPLEEDASAAELAVVVADAWQGRGVGAATAARLLEEARRQGRRRVVAFIHPDNDAMRKICSRLGFVESRSPGETLVRAEIRP